MFLLNGLVDDIFDQYLCFGNDSGSIDKLLGLDLGGGRKQPHMFFETDVSVCWSSWWPEDSC